MVAGKMTPPMRAEDQPVLVGYSHLIARSRPRMAKTHREFAERYIRLATGPYRGEPFRIDRQPFIGLLFDEFDRGIWSTIYCTGPSQSSKTLSAFVIPTLRDIVELREDVLIGVPEADMADDKWQRDFVPTIRESPELSWLMPVRGPGSRGGTVKDRITMANGVMVKIMTRGGQDTAKAGYTAARIRVTEAAGWSRAADASQEADPLRQLTARMRAFRRSQRSLIVEGTTTIEEELPWRARGEDDDERLISTRSRLVVPCPHCEAWVSPEREHLVGWQQAQSEHEAQDLACFACPACGAGINDEERRTANADVRLLHWGQTINSAGDVVGDIPPTNTLWFRWSSFNNCLLDASDTAVDEWKAAQLVDGTMDRENADRELCQFCHALPFHSLLAEDEPLAAGQLQKRAGALPRNTLPEDTAAWVIGCDLGKWSAHWAAVALRSIGALCVPAYGIFSVVRDNTDDVKKRITEAIKEFMDEVCEQGLPVTMQDGDLLPDAVGFDIGYLPDEIIKAINSAGGIRRNRYRGCRGRGSSVRGGQVFSPLKKRSEAKPVSGTRWFGELNHERRSIEITFDADHYKQVVHERFRMKSGTPGSLALFRADSPTEHIRFTNHIANEQLRYTWEPGKGRIGKWVKTGENHFLDSMAIAMVMLDMVLRRKQAAAAKGSGESKRDAGVGVDNPFRMPDGRPFLSLETR